MAKRPGEFRSFGTKGAATRAIEKQGFNLVPHRLDTIRDGSTFRFQPVFTPDLEEDREYIRSKGFKALPPEFA